MTKTYLKRPAAQARAYSQAVVSEGGKVVWLAGQVAAEDASGKPLAGDLTARCARCSPDWGRRSRRLAARSAIW